MSIGSTKCLQAALHGWLLHLLSMYWRVWSGAARAEGVQFLGRSAEPARRRAVVALRRELPHHARPHATLEHAFAGRPIDLSHALERRRRRHVDGPPRHGVAGLRTAQDPHRADVQLDCVGAHTASPARVPRRLDPRWRIYSARVSSVVWLDRIAGRSPSHRRGLKSGSRFAVGLELGRPAQRCAQPPQIERLACARPHVAAQPPGKLRLATRRLPRGGHRRHRRPPHRHRAPAPK